MNATQCWLALDKVGFRTFWLLLSALWQSSILLAAAGLLLYALRRRRPSVRHAILAAAILTSPLIPLLGWAASRSGTPQAPIPVMPTYSPPVLPTEFTPAPPLTGGPGVPEAAIPEIGYSTAPQPVKAAPAENSLSLLAYPWAIVLLGYIAGAGSLLCLVVVGKYRIGRWARGGRVMTDRRILDIFRAARKRLGSDRGFTVVESRQILSPITVGTLHPVVLLPAGLARDSCDEDLLGIALHELAHVRRYDSPLLTLLSFVRALFFFHPLVWLACRQVSALAESACDDAVLDATGQPVSYAKMLARLAEQLPRHALVTELAVGIVWSKGAALRRVEAILSDRRHRIRKLSRLALLGTLVAAAVSAALALALPLGEKNEGQPTTRPATQEQRTGSYEAGNAEVELLTDGRFKDLNQGAKVWADSPWVWKQIPALLRGAKFLHSHSQHQGVTEFKITRPGRLLMACTMRWGGGGNPSGGWKDQIVSRNELLEQGWKPIKASLRAQAPGHSDDAGLGWEVFERLCRKGERLKYRTEKYAAPILVLCRMAPIDVETPVVRWIDVKTGEVLFTLADIIRFDWEKQLFQLRRERAIDLMMLPPKLRREFVIKDDRGEIYRGCFMSSLSSMSYDGPTIRIDPVGPGGVKPPLYKIEVGYGEHREGGSRNKERFRQRLHAALKAGKALKDIDPATFPQPIATSFRGWYGGQHGLKIAATLFPETFRIGSGPRFLLRLAKYKTLDLKLDRLALVVTWLAKGKSFPKTERLELPLDVLERGGYAYRGWPWGPARGVVDPTVQPGRGQVTVQLQALRKSDNIWKVIGTWQIPTLGITIRPPAASRPGGKETQDRHSAGKARASQPTAGQRALRLYPLATKDVSWEQAAKMALAKIDLAAEPLLTSDDIVWYDQRTCRIFLTVKDLVRMSKATGLRLRRGRTVPVVVVVGDERRFLAAIASERFSFSQVQPAAGDRITAVSLVSPRDARDPRDDPAFLAALRQAGRLDRTALARPRMTRDQVVAAARKMNIAQSWEDPKRPAVAVPDTWKVASVTFCREASVAAPSRNVVGFGGPWTVYHCWIVQFEPEGRPAGRRGGTTACVVDHRTGVPRAIFPPGHVAALPVPGTDLVPMVPWRDEKAVREAARKVLKEITSVDFVERVEFRKAKAETDRQAPWSTMRYVWVCRGKDGSGNETEAILRDCFRKPPYVTVRDVETRRKVLPPAPGSTTAPPQVTSHSVSAAPWMTAHFLPAAGTKVSPARLPSC